jgi:hypothetical protein
VPHNSVAITAAPSKKLMMYILFCFKLIIQINYLNLVLMNRSLTKIYFIVLFSSFIGLKAQDTLNIGSTQHFFASVQAGSTFTGKYETNGKIIPISSLYFSYIPKNSKIILSVGPSFSPVFDQSYFGLGINAKVFVKKNIYKHNLIFEMGDRISWNQQTFNNGAVIQTNKYSLNNLYFGPGYLGFLGRENKFFLSFTGNVCVNSYKTIYEAKPSGSSGSGLSSYSGTTLTPAIFVNAGMKLR